MHLTHAGVQRVFVGRGFGRGMAAYERMAGYHPSSKPTKVGARYFIGGDGPNAEYDDDDNLVIDAMGNKWDGGKAAYQQRVYNAAKKVGKERGLKTRQIDELKPRTVA